MSRVTQDFTFTPISSGDRIDIKKARDQNGEPMSLVIDNTCRVFITQIPLERIERDGVNALRAEFEVFGPVEAYKMFTDKSGRFTGSVLCTYRNPADASTAVQHMNGQSIDSSVLKVSLSRNHGVVMLHQSGSRGRRGFDDDDDDDGDGRWQHDRYQAVMQDGGIDSDQSQSTWLMSGGGYGSRRGGRGGRLGGRGAAIGSGRGRGSRHRHTVEEAFERYIASRDKAALDATKDTIIKGSGCENDVLGDGGNNRPDCEGEITGSMIAPEPVGNSDGAEDRKER